MYYLKVCSDSTIVTLNLSRAPNVFRKEGLQNLPMILAWWLLLLTCRGHLTPAQGGDGDPGLPPQEAPMRRRSAPSLSYQVVPVSRPGKDPSPVWEAIPSHTRSGTEHPQAVNKRSVYRLSPPPGSFFLLQPIWVLDIVLVLPFITLFLFALTCFTFLLS